MAVSGFLRVALAKYFGFSYNMGMNATCVHFENEIKRQSFAWSFLDNSHLANCFFGWQEFDFLFQPKGAELQCTKRVTQSSEFFGLYRRFDSMIEIMVGIMHSIKDWLARSCHLIMDSFLSSACCVFLIIYCGLLIYALPQALKVGSQTYTSSIIHRWSGIMTLFLPIPLMAYEAIYQSHPNVYLYLCTVITISFNCIDGGLLIAKRIPKWDLPTIRIFVE